MYTKPKLKMSTLLLCACDSKVGFSQPTIVLVHLEIGSRCETLDIRGFTKFFINPPTFSNTIKV